jgi:hypothetical protein
MAGERDIYGNLLNPGEAYQEFMLQLYDVLALAGDSGYSQVAYAKLTEARLLFLDEFEREFPDHGKGRAIWRQGD